MDDEIAGADTQSVGQNAAFKWADVRKMHVEQVRGAFRAEMPKNTYRSGAFGIEQGKKPRTGGSVDVREQKGKYSFGVILFI